LVAEGGQSLDLKAIEEVLGQRLARFKRPRKLFIIDSLPRNTMGKVQKNILRDEFSSTFKDSAK
jgi:malonyl-CoA/methylmalonyl-CoA synthetase